MDIIEPVNYETIPVKAEAFVIPDYNEFTDDPVKYKQFLDEVNSFISTTYKYKAEMLREKILYIHCGPDSIFAQPGNIIVKYENGDVEAYESIGFSKTFRKV